MTIERDLQWARKDVADLIAQAVREPLADVEQQTQRRKVINRLARVIDYGDEQLRLDRELAAPVLNSREVVELTLRHVADLFEGINGGTPEKRSLLAAVVGDLRDWADAQAVPTPETHGPMPDWRRDKVARDLADLATASAEQAKGSTSDASLRCSATTTSWDDSLVQCSRAAGHGDSHRAGIWVWRNPALPAASPTGADSAQRSTSDQNALWCSWFGHTWGEFKTNDRLTFKTRTCNVCDATEHHVITG